MTSSLHCPECGGDSRVIDCRQAGRAAVPHASRVALVLAEHEVFRRRRECLRCGARWTTWEVARELVLDALGEPG